MGYLNPKRKSWLAAGLCYRCGGPNVTGSVKKPLCTIHKEESLQSVRDWLLKTRGPAKAKGHRKAVRDLTTQKTYDCQKACAKALEVSYPTFRYWLRCKHPRFQVI